MHKPTAVPHRIHCLRCCTLAALEWASVNKQRVVVHGTYASNAYLARPVRKPTQDVDLLAMCSSELEFFSVCECLFSFLSERLSGLRPSMSHHYSTSPNSALHVRPMTFVVRCMGERVVDMTMASYDLATEVQPAVVPWDSVGMTSVDQQMPCFPVNIVSIRRIILGCAAVARDASNYRRERDAFDMIRYRLLAERNLLFDTPLGPLDNCAKQPQLAARPASPSTKTASEDACSLRSVPTLDLSIERADARDGPPRLVVETGQAACSVAKTVRLTESSRIASAQHTYPMQMWERSVVQRISKSFQRGCDDVDRRLADMHDRAEDERRLWQQLLRKMEETVRAQQDTIAQIEQELHRWRERLSRSFETSQSITEHVRTMFVGLASTGCFFGVHDMTELLDALPKQSFADVLHALVSLCFMSIAHASGCPVRLDEALSQERFAVPVGATQRLIRRLVTSHQPTHLTAAKMKHLEEELIASAFITPGWITTEESSPSDNAWVMMKMICHAFGAAIDKERKQFMKELDDMVVHTRRAQRCADAIPKQPAPTATPRKKTGGSKQKMK